MGQRGRGSFGRQRRVLKAGPLPVVLALCLLAPALSYAGTVEPATSPQISPIAPPPGVRQGPIQPGMNTRPGAIKKEKPVVLGRITGRLLTLHGRKPLAGGTVYFFNVKKPAPSRDMYWRVPDKQAPITADGSFSVKLPMGGYYMGAIKRQSPELTSKVAFGPPENGDLFFGAAMKNGKPKVFQVKKDRVLNIGAIAGAVPFRRKTITKGVTAIEGKVIYGKNGKPLAGMVVCAYIKATTRGRPLFVSDKTGPGGRYILRVNKGGVFYLTARQQYGGGRPKPGSLAGAYSLGPQTETAKGERKKMEGVGVKTGQIAGNVNINVFKVPKRGRQAGRPLPPGQNQKPVAGQNIAPFPGPAGPLTPANRPPLPPGVKPVISAK